MMVALMLGLSASAQRTEYNFDSEWKYTFEGKSHTATLPRAFNEDYAYKVAIDKLPDDTVRYVKTFRLQKSAKGTVISLANVLIATQMAHTATNAKNVVLHFLH